MHFRRQAPIGIYITDFAWHAGKLVVEIDGGQHAQAQQTYDERRTSWLQSQGYRVLRFWNNDVMKTSQSVGDEILRAARESGAEEPHPRPLPTRGRGARPRKMRA
jgi:adenine-specific DNA-methyltransferase